MLLLLSFFLRYDVDFVFNYFDCLWICLDECAFLSMEVKDLWFCPSQQGMEACKFEWRFGSVDIKSSFDVIYLNSIVILLEEVQDWEKRLLFILYNMERM